MDEELKVGILEKNGNGQGDSNRIVNRNTQVHSAFHGMWRGFA